MVVEVYFIDKKDGLEARSSDSFELVAGLLMEIHSRSIEWIDGIRKAKGQKEYKWDYGGNAFGLRIYNQIAEIFGYYVADDEKNIKIPTKDLIALLEAWLKFLKSPNQVPSSFLVTVVADEG